MTQFHVKHPYWAATIGVCLLYVVLMTSLVLLSMIGLPKYVQPSGVAPGQVPHFVCTADGDGTLLRCSLSSIAKPPL